MKCIAIILAGGSGTRLWPLSRSHMPKQFLSLVGERSLLQDTCQRLFPLIENQWIITGQEHFQQVVNQINPLGNPVEILEEPVAKNTAPAIFWASRRCQQLYGDDCIVLVLPSDHFIINELNFLDCMRMGIEKAREGNLIAFGIKPEHPETGYGYIKVEESKLLPFNSYPISAFMEKPNRETAEQYVASETYLWNSGMFVFHLGTLLEEAKRLCPEVAEPFLNCDPFDAISVRHAYEQTKALSIDFAVMEKTNRAFVIPASFGWSDVGSWESIYLIRPRNEMGNATSGEHILIDSHNCLLYGSNRLIATIGLREMVIIDTPDVLMICPLNQTQRVREIIDELKYKKPEAI